LALSALLAALYAVLVIALAGISFQLVQVRVADALIPLSVVFGWPAVVGVALGCIISNVVSPMPSIVVDIVFGATANFVASLLAWKISDWRRKRSSGRGSFFVYDLLGCLTATVIVTFVVGTYLAVLTQMELWVWWVGIGVGSLISICGIGYALLQVLRRVEIR
jgi:uncharacterized membrane protein